MQKLQPGQLVIFGEKFHAIYTVLDDEHLVISPLKNGKPLYRIRTYVEIEQVQVRTVFVEPPKTICGLRDEAGKLSDTLTYSEAGTNL